jgi:hypothetical protein
LVCTVTAGPVSAAETEAPVQPLSWELCMFACNLVMVACMDACTYQYPANPYPCFGGCVGGGTLCQLGCGEPQPEEPPQNGWICPGSSPAALGVPFTMLDLGPAPVAAR